MGALSLESAQTTCKKASRRTRVSSSAAGYCLSFVYSPFPLGQAE